MSQDLVTRKGFCRICLRVSEIDTHYPNEIYAKDRGFTVEGQTQEFTIPCDFCNRKMYNGDQDGRITK